MILIQDGSQPPNIDKPLRIIGDPYKVQVGTVGRWFARLRWWSNGVKYELCFFFFFSKQRKWWMKFLEKEIMLGSGSEMNMDQGWEEVAMALMYVRMFQARWVLCEFILYLTRFFLISQIAVPRHSVGVVIGRNGEMIKKIQSDAGVKIQFKPGECDSTANSFKIILILTYAGTLNTHRYFTFWCTPVLLNNSWLRRWSGSPDADVAIPLYPIFIFWAWMKTQLLMGCNMLASWLKWQGKCFFRKCWHWAKEPSQS